MFDEIANAMVEQKFYELQKIGRHHARSERFLGSDLDDAISSAIEHFLSCPTSTKSTEAIFRVCLRREQAKRLKFADKHEMQKEK